ncbi:GGDEF domain-containing protein [Robertmurraya korlensis]|uniref:GGDEF domain-containing protein n=1 Tax=Robertmurraya korlensis TaxID=519977 RepID=UPI00203C6E02|nr:GGDEF domain-containing protein [Robertmurraya korlensis]MCM3602977.1 GGDEF domain-containing protein [Robertmurraya korlensis]
MKTIFVILVTGHVFTVFLISAYWRDHRTDKTVTTFFLAKCVQALSWTLLTLRGGISDVFTISVANTLLFLGTSFEMMAILRLLNVLTKRIKIAYLIMTFINIVAFHLAILFLNLESNRIAVASFGTAMLMILPVYHLVFKHKPSRLRRILGMFYLFLALALCGRGIVTLVSAHTWSFFTPGFFQTLSFIGLYLVMLIGNTGFILILKEQADQELIRLASYDDLTGALNRRVFFSEAKKCLSACSKNKQPISLILFDIDYFKKINDRYGHDVGDHVLREFSQKIQKYISKGHYFSRFGGDEFAILLPETDEEQSMKLAQEICKAIEMESLTEGGLSYTVSMGILTIIPTVETELETMYVACDRALYEAKRNGRNGVSRGFLSIDGIEDNRISQIN